MVESSSRLEWPTEFKMVKVIDSFIGKDLTIFFVSGIVNKKQYKYVEDVIDVLAVHEIEDDRLVLSTLLRQEQLEQFYEVYEPRSRQWRGQYYSLANAVVDAYTEVMKS